MASVWFPVQISQLYIRCCDTHRVCAESFPHVGRSRGSKSDRVAAEDFLRQVR